MYGVINILKNSFNKNKGKYNIYVYSDLSSAISFFMSIDNSYLKDNEDICLLPNINKCSKFYPLKI